MGHGSSQGVDHRGSDVIVAKQFLDRADVMATFESVGGLTGPQGSVAEPLRMTEAVRGGGLTDLCLDHGAANRFLHQARIEMMPTLLSCLLIAPALVLGEHPLPVPLLVRVPVLTSEHPGSLHTSVPLSKVFLVQASHLS
jgi:hypothetical protein